MKRKIATIALCCLSLCARIAWAESVDPALTAKFKQLLAQLDSDDWRVRDAASQKVAALPAEALPLVEQALLAHDLSPEVQQRLSEMVGDLRRNGATAARTKAAAKLVTAYRDQMLSDYDSVGRHNAKWDARAHDAIVKHVSVVTNTGGRKGTNETVRALQTVLSAGCDDPMLRWMEAVDQESLGHTAEQADALRGAVDALLASKYPAQTKAAALLSAAKSYVVSPMQILSYSDARAVRKDLGAACELLPQTKAAPFPTATARLDMMNQIFDLFCKAGEVSVNIIDPLAKLVEASSPNAEDSQIFRCTALLAVAADINAKAQSGDPARAAGLVSQVMEMRNHAKQIAAEMSERNPKSLAAARILMRCDAALGDVEGVQQMYDAAIALDEIDFETRSMMLDYLVARGEPDALLRFADECFDTHAFNTRVPLISVAAVVTMSTKQPPTEQAAFLRTDPIWSRIERGYRAYLEVMPQNDVMRSNFAWWSCQAEKWNVAEEQFRIIGDNVDPRLFGSPEVAQYMAKKAHRLAEK